MQPARSKNVSVLQVSVNRNVWRRLFVRRRYPVLAQMSTNSVYIAKETAVLCALKWNAIFQFDFVPFRTVKFRYIAGVQC